MRYALALPDGRVVESDTLTFSADMLVGWHGNGGFVKDRHTGITYMLGNHGIPQLVPGDTLHVRIPESSRRPAYDNPIPAKEGTRYRMFQDPWSDKGYLFAKDADGTRRETELAGMLQQVLAERTNAPHGEVTFTDSDYESMLHYVGCHRTVPETMARPSVEATARALFRTDPRVVQLVARVSDGRNDMFDRAWDHEHSIRAECLARAEAMWKT